MNLLKKLSILTLACIVLPLQAQRSMTPDDLANWNRITQKALSDDGRWVGYKTTPWIGDATIHVRSVAGDSQFSVHPAGEMFFSSSSKYAVISRVTSKAVSDSLKLRKTKKELMPLPQLVVYNLGGKVSYIDSVKNFAMADSADWIAYRQTTKDSTLYVRSLDGHTLLKFPNVSEYSFAKKNAHLWFITAGDSSQVKAGLYTLEPGSGSATLIKEGKGRFARTSFNPDGSAIAFLYCEQKDSVNRALDLWLSVKDGQAKSIASRGEAFLPAGWIISQYGDLKFSKSGRRLFFGTSPAPHEADTTQLAENRPEVQIWTWNEPQQHTVQNYRLQRDLEKSYAAVYHLDNGKTIQIETEDAPHSSMVKTGDAPYALLYDSKPYEVSSMWEGREKRDFYALSLDNGERRLLRKADYGDWGLSPEGNYAYWYAETDSSYYTLEMADGSVHRLTTPATFAAWDEENDVPDYPSAYGTAGWTTDDSSLLIYDRYDIWRFDPKGSASPVNLTLNGRTKNMRYQYIPTDNEEDDFMKSENYYGAAVKIDLSKPQLLTGTNEKTKTNSFFKADLSRPAAPTLLIGGYSRLTFVAKAKNSNATLFTSESFEQAPEIRVSDMSFKKSMQISHIGDQQKKFIWGTAELVHWTSLDGRQLDGVLYKPTNFDPAKKYPMIVNFYERNSDDLYKYRIPEIHRSTVDYHLYLSNGYLIFNPDVRYKDGHPGESCFNCVMPGIASIVAKGFVNEKAIGAQGHSWGGYQVAYLATRTDKFAAIESGAPVVNMFSAYGGIRWGSGLARSFQYEHTQSRIGGTPWSAPELYKENSPLFNMDKVTTPILIMHNDADGHVPWYQGIEYFVALRRLQKPAWLLDYVGEPHWPLKRANEKDFQIRMFQFFNHYLKGEAMPKWMKEGIPATDQSFELGYGLEQKEKE